MSIRHLFAVALFACGLLARPHPAHAAQSYDNCNNFIDTIPTTISTQGVWCLRHDLATNISSGNAITIAANNVTIDCNDFKLGGLAAGPASLAFGIGTPYDLNTGNHAVQQNAVVRHCNVRGFLYGVFIYDGAGHLVEDNRFDNNLLTGIYLRDTDTSMVRRNRIYDTGGRPDSEAYAIQADAEILDNTISGVFATSSGNRNAYGISAGGSGTRIDGNLVANVVPAGSGYVTGILAHSINAFVTNNRVAQITVSNPFDGRGIDGPDTLSQTLGFCAGNLVSGFTEGIVHCRDSGGNDSYAGANGTFP